MQVHIPPHIGQHGVVLLLAVAAALCLLFVGGSTACTDDGFCTTMGCGSSAILFVDEDGVAGEPGPYTASLVLGDETLKLVYDLHSSGSQTAGGLRFETGPGRIHIDSLGESIAVYRGPIEMTLTTAKGSQQQTFTPDWTSYEPNGPSCSPTCSRFEGSFTVPRALWDSTWP